MLKKFINGFSVTTNIGTATYTFLKFFMRDKDTDLNNSEIHRFCLFTNSFGSESRESPEVRKKSRLATLASMQKHKQFFPKKH